MGGLPPPASRWGYDSLWLHVDAPNDAGVALYKRAGYGTVYRTLRLAPLGVACLPDPLAGAGVVLPRWTGARQQVLMSKSLPPYAAAATVDSFGAQLALGCSGQVHVWGMCDDGSDAARSPVLRLARSEAAAAAAALPPRQEAPEVESQWSKPPRGSRSGVFVWTQSGDDDGDDSGGSGGAPTAGG